MKITKKKIALLNEVAGKFGYAVEGTRYPLTIRVDMDHPLNKKKEEYLAAQVSFVYSEDNVPELLAVRLMFVGLGVLKEKEEREHFNNLFSAMKMCEELNKMISGSKSGEKKFKFRHENRYFEMTAREIEAAYYYQERLFKQDDAARQFNILVFGDETPNFKKAEYNRIVRQFEEDRGVPFEVAKALIPEYADRFFQVSDCNEDENSTWDIAINQVLTERKGK